MTPIASVALVLAAAAGLLVLAVLDARRMRVAAAAARIYPRRPPARRASRAVLVATAVALAGGVAATELALFPRPHSDLNVAVVFVLDLSKSMNARDVAPSRGRRASIAVETALAHIRNGRVALVGFAGDAALLCPLTTDFEAFRAGLHSAQTDAIMGGTSLRAGLERALKALPPDDRMRRAIVLVSDGEDLEGGFEPVVEAARRAAIPIYTLGVGTERGSIVPTSEVADGFDPQRDEAGQIVVSRLDPIGLRRIANVTGGSYRQLVAADTTVWDFLDRPASSTTGRGVLPVARRWRLLLALAILALALEVFLRTPRKATVVVA